MDIIICTLLPILESTESVRGLEGGHSRVHQPGPGAGTLPSGKLTFLLLDARSPVLHVEGSRTLQGREDLDDL
jgi:hypothetical protein